MNITEFTDYRDYLKAYIANLPGGGRGFSTRLAEAVSVSPVIISQVLSGKRSFSLEQAYDVASFLGLTELEEEFFLEMIQYDRAGNFRLKKFHEKRLKRIFSQLDEVKNRVKQKKELDDKAKAFYYANWYMVAIRLLINNPYYNSVERISKGLSLSQDKVKEALIFLEEYQLIDQRKGKYFWKGTSTHISANSPLVNRHHQNWRLQAMKRMEKEKPKESELFFSSPMIINEECARQLRSLIMNFISESQDMISEAPSEDIYSMNIDLFIVNKP